MWERKPAVGEHAHGEERGCRGTEHSFSSCVSPSGVWKQPCPRPAKEFNCPLWQLLCLSRWHYLLQAPKRCLVLLPVLSCELTYTLNCPKSISFSKRTSFLIIQSQFSVLSFVEEYWCHSVLIVLSNVCLVGQVLSGWLSLLSIWLRLWLYLHPLCEARPAISLHSQTSSVFSPCLSYFNFRGRKQPERGRTYLMYLQ